MRQEKIHNAVARQMALFESAFEEQGDLLCGLADQLVTIFNQGGKLLLAGAGPLAPVADMIANLFLHRLAVDRPQLPACSLSQAQALGHVLAHAGAVQELYTRQLQVLGAPGDLLIGLSDGQHAPQLEDLLAEAREQQLTTVLVAPSSGDGASRADLCFVTGTELPVETAVSALFFGRLLCEQVEHVLFGI